eukprot:gene25731-31471_t
MSKINSVAVSAGALAACLTAGPASEGGLGKRLAERRSRTLTACYAVAGLSREWGSTAAAVVAGLGLERELLAPPPPALAQVTAVADLHAKYAQATEELAVLVCALSYSLAPFLVPVVLHNRRLQHLGNELPWRDATLAFAALCGFAFLACCLVKFTEAERPNLAVYRSQAMAVLHLEATSRATPLLPLKTAAGASGCASIRGLLSIAILLIASAGEHIVLGALLREQLRG